MESFLSEIFDVRGIDHSLFFDSESGVLSHQKLLSDSRLVSNAAFRYAWQQLSGGATPSARCYAEFSRTHGPTDGKRLDHIVAWLMHDPNGPFAMIGGTPLLSSRLASLTQERFSSYVSSLETPSSPVLHSSLVEKLIDRHSLHDCSLDDFLQIPLLHIYSRHVLVKRQSNDIDIRAMKYSNVLSGMLAPIEEEESDAADALACMAPHHVSSADCIKRRFARDLHYLRKSFEKPYVTADRGLMAHAEVVRMSIGAPWAVCEDVAATAERHMPTIASACVRLHSFSNSILRRPCNVIEDNKSFLVVFDADSATDEQLSSLARDHGYGRVFRALTWCSPNVHEHVSSVVTGSPLVYSLFFGENGIDDWTYGLLASSLRRHLSGRCPMESSAPRDAHILMDRFIIRLAHSRNLLHSSRDFIQCGCTDSSQVILAIDNRPDPSATVLSIMIALSSLDRGQWAVRLMCSRANRGACERIFATVMPGAPVTLDDSSPHLNVPLCAFDVETCINSLMKCSSTWTALRPARNVLVVQDDGILVRRGLERLVSDSNGFSYIGAPWADFPPNAPLKSRVPSLVGNGGISLRDVEDMVRFSERAQSTDEQHRLFCTRMEALPEDVFFAEQATLARKGGCGISDERIKDIATKFACEQVPVSFALAYHKPWPYWQVCITHSVLEVILAEEARGNLSVKSLDI